MDTNHSKDPLITLPESVTFPDFIKCFMPDESLPQESHMAKMITVVPTPEGLAIKAPIDASPELVGVIVAAATGQEAFEYEVIERTEKTVNVVDTIAPHNCQSSSFNKVLTLPETTKRVVRVRFISNLADAEGESCAGK